MGAYIVGGAVAKVDRHFDLGYRDLAYEVTKECSGCLDVDYIVVSSALPELTAHQVDLGTHIAQWLGRRVPVIRVESGETSGLAAVDLAASLVASGRGRKVLVLGVEKVTDYPTYTANYFYSLMLDYEFEVLRGVSPPAYAALAMKELMKDGVRRECFSSWAVRMHENAASIPHAMLGFKISYDSFKDSQVLAEPLTLHDSFALGDGAAAVVVSNSPDPKASSVEILFSAAEVELPAYSRERISDLNASSKLLKLSLERYGLDLRRVAVELHDSYTPYPIAILRSLGYLDSECDLSELEYLNVSGGLKARGHPIGATGIYQVYEVFKLLTDKLGGKTSPSDYGLVHSMSGPDNVSRVLILRR
jgi:acetyl-CoA C-acetyltransferase/acetyl-CoA acyltransferase